MSEEKIEFDKLEISKLNENLSGFKSASGFLVSELRTFNSNLREYRKEIEKLNDSIVEFNKSVRKNG